MRKAGVVVFLIVVIAVVMFIKVESDELNPKFEKAKPMDLSSYSKDPPKEKVDLLFIHHSCGGQLFAPVAPKDDGKNCIYKVAENGGGLRPILEQQGYVIHEASYHSIVGDKTDIFHWPPKFQKQMEQVLTCDLEDKFFPPEGNRRNRIVLFKSCYPNNLFTGRGQPPGNPAGPELTVENAKAAYRALLPEFKKHPEVLFVAFTAPPKVFKADPLFKHLAKMVLGRGSMKDTGPLAREFNTWMVDAQTGWLSEYDGSNVVVFDLYDVLTDYGVSNFSRYGSGPNKDDDHPSSEGNKKAAAVFAPFLNQAVHRWGGLKPAEEPQPEGAEGVEGDKAAEEKPKEAAAPAEAAQ